MLTPPVPLLACLGACSHHQSRCPTLAPSHPRARPRCLGANADSAGEWQKALALFSGLRNAGGATDAAVYHAAISAAGSAADVALARQLLAEMREHLDEAPGLRAYNGALKACERAADWEGAMALMDEMRMQGLAPDRISLTYGVGALGRAGQTRRALELWKQMRGEEGQTDPTALATLLRALSGAGEWQSALDVFDEVLADDADGGRTSTSTVFAAALGACARGAQPEKALQLLRHMPAVGVAANAACYHGVADAHAAAGDWKGAVSVWQDMIRQDMRPLPETWRLVHDACRKAGRDAEADSISEYAEREGMPLTTIADGD